MSDILGDPDPNDPRLDEWVVTDSFCAICGRRAVAVMTVFHYETGTGEQYVCLSCLALNELSKN